MEMTGLCKQMMEMINMKMGLKMMLTVPLDDPGSRHLQEPPDPGQEWSPGFDPLQVRVVNSLEMENV